MLVEFPCPVCMAPLAIKKQVVGGQVNCPKCQKLILLPSTSPLVRKDPDQSPFNTGCAYSSEEVCKAIQASVEPYRRDLESKTNLLNDAVEMVKIRNERIKEVETLMLNAQKDLWALEVEYDEQRQECKRLYKELHEARQEGAQHDGEALESLQGELRDVSSRKDLLKSKVVDLVTHSDNLSGQLQLSRDLLKPEGPLRDFLENVERLMKVEVKRSGECEEAVVQAAALLNRAAEELLRQQTLLREADQQRVERDELLHSASQDMQLALDERNQWRKRVEELEKKEKSREEVVAKLELEVGELQRQRKEWEEDRESQLREKAELDEIVDMLRTRLDKNRSSS